MGSFKSLSFERLICYAFFCLVVSTPAFSDYYVTGKIIGHESVLLGFGSKEVNVDAVKQDGRWFEPSTRYAEVSSYRDGRCWINFGWAMKSINAWQGTSFYEIKDGTARKLNLSDISFPCVKR